MPGDGGRTETHEQDEDDRFPYQQLGVLAICRLAEPIAFCSIIAYSFVMVQDIKGEKDASFYSGLLISAFAMAEACTAMLWGSLSDRYGRKPIILVALAGTALSSLVFGFAKNYWVALVARAIGGLLNGNLAVMQTMVTEMVKRPEHEPKAYALQPFMWFLGSIAGSSLGGFTAQPAKFYPDLFSEDGLFGQYPYLLPNLVSIAVILVAMTLGALLLKETNPAIIARSTAGNDNVDERTPLQQGSSRASEQRRESGVSGIAVTMPTPTDPSFDLRRPSFASLASTRPLLPDTKGADMAATISDDESTTSKPIRAFNRSVVSWIVALGLMSYHQMAFVTVLPIYLLDSAHSEPHHLDLQGGLGLSLHDVGRYLAVNSLMALIVQGAVFPIYVSWLGVYWTVVTLTLFNPLVEIAVPFVSLLPNPGVGVYVAMFVQSICSIMVYPTALILLKNATESSTVLGRVNGLAMSVCSFARTVSPPVVGIIYSDLGSAAGYWSCAIVAAAAAVNLAFVPKEQRSGGDDEGEG